MTSNTRRTLCSAGCLTSKLDPLLGLHFGNVLETRYALNGDLRVAYRTTRDGPCDMVFVPNWFTYYEVLPEIPFIRGWVEAMTSSRACPASGISSPSLLSSG